VRLNVLLLVNIEHFDTQRKAQRTGLSVSYLATFRVLRIQRALASRMTNRVSLYRPSEQYLALKSVSRLAMNDRLSAFLSEAEYYCAWNGTNVEGRRGE